SQVKTGPYLAGRANLFVSLADRYRRPEVLGNIDDIFARVPGYVGHTLMIEPSLVLGGMSGGAQAALQPELERIPGVRFAFSNGDSLVLVLHSSQDAAAVQKAARSILSRYHVVEVRFPMSYSSQDAMLTARQVAAALQRQHPGASVVDVTSSRSGDDLTSLTTTLMEMRRFLISYASQINIQVDPGVRLQPGDQVALPGLQKGPLVEGAPINSRNLLIQVLSVEAGKAQGLIIQGDARPLVPEANPGNRPDTSLPGWTFVDSQAFRFSHTGYKVTGDNRVGPRVGMVQVYNDRYQLMLAIDESVLLLRQLSALSRDASATAVHVDNTLAAVADTLTYMGKVRDVLAKVNQSLQGPLGDLKQINLASLASSLRQASASIRQAVEQSGQANLGVQQAAPLLQELDQRQKQLEAQLQAATPNTPEYARLKQVYDQLLSQKADVAGRAQNLDQMVAQLNPVTAQLWRWQAQMDSMADQLDHFDALASDSQAVNSLFENLGSVTSAALGVLQKIDAPAMQRDVQIIAARLDKLNQINVDAIITQMEKVKEALPRLQDEDIGRSVRLLDRYLGGQVIPGQRLQLLTDASLSPGQAAQAAAAVTGVKDLTAFASPAGSVQPDVRGQIYQILQEVRASIAGIVAIAVVLLLLILDHSTLMAAMRVLSRRERRGSTWRGRNVWLILADKIYGITVGSLLLSGTFRLTQAALPWLDPGRIVLLGAGMGLMAAWGSERLSPVHLEEMEAGEAYGLSFCQVLTEIIIPEGRPGLLQWLNRRHMIFAGRRARKPQALRPAAGAGEAHAG
ncbi:MAG: hypothetical protein IMW99_05680, partial [Firmicutes bacterium]|nr:hypothetical protein [Bacillota bacterium]